jgi:peptidoglycan/xylan/chitin deacetylase (PgdA/CDA1 family)
VTIGRFLRRRWEKNWPEARAAMQGGLPRFVTARDPLPLRDGVPVFVFHAVPHQTLAADLEFLARNGYTTIDAGTLLAHLDGSRPAPRGSVVLTFDDGARNLYETVFPLLRRFDARAVAFVAPRFHDAKTHALGPASHRRRPCTFDELREMDGSGHVDVQSHSFEHRYLPRWPEPIGLSGIDEIYLEARGEPLPVHEDLRIAREILEQELGKPIRHLAYPRFLGTPSALDTARAVGYLAVWGGPTAGRPLNTPADDPSTIVRLSGEFLRRLPGSGRVPLPSVLRDRYLGRFRHGG